MKLTKNYLEKLGPHQLSELAEFVVTENMNHHSTRVHPATFRKMIKLIYNEEVKYYNNSQIFVFKDYIGFIIGSIRVLKWNYIDVLPIQKLFGIIPLSLIKNSRDVYHIGRLTIKSEIRDIKLFKQLIVYAIAPVCQHEGNIAFAECDRKLQRTLNLLGIKTKVLGKPISYLGSETIPISISFADMIEFYTKNKYLITDLPLKEDNASLIHQDVVSNYYQHYYSFV